MSMSNKIGLKIIPPDRGVDPAGSGEFGAPRSGGRVHRGVDIAVLPGSRVLSLTAGVITRIGFPYHNDTVHRYIEVVPGDFYAIRYFYVSPQVEVGQMVSADSILGTAQDVTLKYPREGMTPHIHVEVIAVKTGERVDPGQFFS